MGRRAIHHLRRWPFIVVGITVLAASCGTGTGAEDALTNARAPSSTAGGGINTQGSVRVVIPDPPDINAEPPSLTTLVEDPSSTPPPSAPSTGVADSQTSTPSTAKTFTPTIAGDSGTPSAYSIVAQATVPEMAARVAPADDAVTVADFSNPTGSGSPLVFRAVDGVANTPDWIEVHLPIKPNGSTGWVRRDEVELTNNPYRLEVDRGSYSLRVFYRNDLWLEATVAIGNGATPTPVGDFYLLELLRPLTQNGPYGPFAFGLSGFSEVLETFGGADAAIIGLHGTNDPSSIGTDVSHGCIRLDNAVIEQLASTLPLGTPVRIT